MALSAERLDRQEAALERAQAGSARDQAAIDRESAEGERNLAASRRDPGQVIERSVVLRRRARAAIEAFAASEDEVARIHEELAAGDPERRVEYQRAVEKARAGARAAREILRTFRD
ncbi:MAG TPA: hypothetical protein VF162_09580 [Streptosporangiaceae bacterium]